MSKKQIKITAIVIAVIFLLGIAGPLAYIAFSAPPDGDNRAADIAGLNEKIKAVDAEIEELDKKLAAAEKLEKNQSEDIGRRFRVMCEKGVGSYLDIIFSSTSLSDFTDRIVIARELAEYDKSVTDAIAEVKAEISAAAEAKSAAQAELLRLRDELSALEAAEGEAGYTEKLTQNRQ
ncbi:MAG: hypothetical protein Q4E94_03505 [Clostridia bacterium]|nr:hypothetical protein [Clostridia bacterium]